MVKAHFHKCCHDRVFISTPVYMINSHSQDPVDNIFSTHITLNATELLWDFKYNKDILVLNAQKSELLCYY